MAPSTAVMPFTDISNAVELLEMALDKVPHSDNGEVSWIWTALLALLARHGHEPPEGHWEGMSHDQMLLVSLNHHAFKQEPPAETRTGVACQVSAKGKAKRPARKRRARDRHLVPKSIESVLGVLEAALDGMPQHDDEGKGSWPWTVFMAILARHGRKMPRHWNRGMSSEQQLMIARNIRADADDV